MKKLLLIIAIALAGAGLYAENAKPYLQQRSLYQQLVAINSNWAKYISDTGIWSRPVAFADDQEYITTDLLLVEAFLRQRDVSGLSQELKKARMHNLDEFHTYIMAGRFPMNYDHEERRPCFIDRDGGVCAVGNLLVQSGQGRLAGYIAKNYEYACVKEINVEGLVKWQQASGLTLEELALIQPSYDWGGRKGYRSTPKFTLSPLYCFDVFAINTQRDLFSIRPENYRHMYSCAYGLEFTKMFKNDRDWQWLTGCFFSSSQYVHRVEGAFGTSAQYGQILTQLNPEYISVPLMLGYMDENSHSRTIIRFGYRADFLYDFRSSVLWFGNVTPADLAFYSFNKNDYSKMRSNIQLGLSFEKNFDWGDERLWLRFSPEISFQATPDQKNARELSYKPIVCVVKTGLVYDLSPNKNTKVRQRRIDRRKRREARKVRKQQLREKKKKEKEEKETQKKKEG
jgi:hypothetical protein